MFHIFNVAIPVLIGSDGVHVGGERTGAQKRGYGRPGTDLVQAGCQSGGGVILGRDTARLEWLFRLLPQICEDLCDVNYAKELNVSTLHPTQVCAFIHFQGLSAAVETFTVARTATQMCTVALTITKPMLLRKSEKKIR